MAAAVMALTSTDRIVAVQGVSGAGKSTMLSSVARNVEQEGGKIIGLALMKATAECLHNAGTRSFSKAVAFLPRDLIVDAQVLRGIAKRAADLVSLEVMNSLQHQQLPDLTLLALFGVGSLVMRGAGCTINDMWDRNIDKHLERTRDRPITSGQVSLFDALVYTGAQLGLGLMILLQFNWYSVLLGAASMGLVVTYPLMKRFTYYPQFVLGLAFNWG